MTAKFKPAILFHQAVAEDASRDPGVTIISKPGVFGDPDAERCRAFRAGFASTFSLAKLDPLYALPERLVEEISDKMPGWLSPDELKFERALSEFCQMVGAIGIAEDSFVTSTLFEPITVPRPPIAAKRMAENRTPHPCADLAEQIYVVLRGYLGWLLTNPIYLKERECIRTRRLQLGLRRSFCLFFDGGNDLEFRQFLQKWMLTEMRSWEIPVPQGPNLSGAAWPVSATNLPGRVNLSVPSTVSLPASFPLQQVVSDARQLNTLEHLRPWQQILERKVGKNGIDHFATLFRLHFFMDIALRSRYGPRMNRRTAQFDRAFGKFMHLSDDRIKQLRLHAGNRIAGH